MDIESLYTDFEKTNLERDLGVIVANNLSEHVNSMVGKANKILRSYAQKEV